MKNIICGFFIVISAAAISAFVEPIHPRLLQYKEGQNYFFTSDCNGRLLYVDLNETNDLEPRFDALKDVVLMLYTRSNPTTATIIKLGDVSTLGSYGKTKATKIVAHGWNNDGNSEMNSLIRDAYLKVMDINFIVVDWGKGSNGLYTLACGNVPKVGTHVANLIDWLIGEGSSVNNFHVMGHSLGAHVAGIAGRSVTKGQIPYLSGFDPANPLWGSGSQRIRSSDAGYVEIIHTNSGNLGISEPLGDNDFYPNEGSGQPGCSITNVGCSHGRSFEFFADSIDHTGFQAYLCKDHKEALNNKCSNIEKLHMGGAKVKPAKNPIEPNELIIEDVEKLNFSNFNKKNPVKIIVHGWQSNGNGLVNTLITNEFLSVSDVNIICVDWGYAANGLYTTAVNSAPKVGKTVAKLIDWLQAEGVPMAAFHLMGHSIGAHIAGIAARSVSRGLISIVTGFDPASPLWSSDSERIRRTDAIYVEIIHTNAGSLGLTEALGDNDFYPNGGSRQPGCSFFEIGCSHSRSYEFFADSLDHQFFTSTQCIDYNELYYGKCSNISEIHMGGTQVKKGRGLYLLKTNSKKPYYKD